MNGKYKRKIRKCKNRFSLNIGVLSLNLKRNLPWPETKNVEYNTNKKCHSKGCSKNISGGVLRRLSRWMKLFL